MSHDKFYGVCKSKCLVEITPDSVGAAKTDLSNVDNTIFLEKATEAGVGGGVVAIENGGTGATTVEEARDNLGVAAADHTHSEVENRLSTLESTIGTLNDSLEGVLNGNGD